MPLANFILQDWDRQSSAFLSQLDGLRKKSGRKLAHDTRVIIKKLRSYLKLREALTKEEWKDEFKPLQFLFRALGRQRDVEISAALFLKWEKKENRSIPSFKKYLRPIGTITRKSAEQTALEFDDGLSGLTHKMHTSLSPFSDAVLQQKIEGLVQSRLQHIRDFPGGFRENIHPTRKSLKDIYYWLKACPANLLAGSGQFSQLEKTLTRLGYWQDLSVLSRKLKNFSTECLVKDSGEFNAAKHIRAAIKKGQSELVKEIEQRLNSVWEKQKV